MIKVKQLKKSFGGNQVLNGVDICIDKGECICIIGPSDQENLHFFGV